MEVALAAAPARAADFVELTKPRITFLVLVTAAVGYALGVGNSFHPGVFLSLLVGTALVSGGASALNQWMERDADALMARTASRPLPSGRLSPADALAFGLSISVVGLALLAGAVNGLTALLAAVTLATYVLAYTPLKRVTSLCTLVGAVPGAIPPMMGWAAARGTLSREAWALFAVLFLWQLPHFLSIAWIYREDYARAGFPMLPVTDPAASPPRARPSPTPRRWSRRRSSRALFRRRGRATSGARSAWGRSSSAARSPSR